MLEERLRSVVLENNRKIDLHSQEYASNESAVRNTLVEPILQALGWKTQSLEEVTTEVRTEDGKFLDYVLIIKGKELLVVEAKNQREDLERHLTQLATYCTSMGIPFGVITNGSIWILFKAFEEGVKGRERIVFKIDLQSDDTAYGKLIRISKERISDLSLLKEQLVTFQETWENVLDNPDIIVKALQPRVKELLENRDGSIEFQEEDLLMFLRERIAELLGTPAIMVSPIQGEREKPLTDGKGVMTLNGTSYAFKTFKEIIIRTAEWLISSNKLSHRNTPVPLGPTRYLINTSKDNPKGKKMIRPKKLSNGLFLETNASSYDCERWARKLMRACGVDDSYLKITRNE